MRMKTTTLIAAAASALLTTTLATSANAAGRAGTPGTPGPRTCSGQLVPAPAGQGSDFLYYETQPGGSDAALAPFTGADYASVISPSDAWFTGFDGGSPWVLHWNGSSVTPAAPVPQGQGTGSTFNYVSANFVAPSSFSSDTDGWILGADSFTTYQFADHWDGSRWTMIPLAATPDAATEAVTIDGIATLSPHDAWAVGDFSDGTKPTNIAPTGALIEHWDGTQWTIVPNPASSLPFTELLQVSAVSPDNVWAVGYTAGSTSSGFIPFAEHYNGTSWTVLPAPPLGSGYQSGMLTSVSADGGGDAWFGGWQQLPGGGSDEIGASQLVDHWDGSTWTAVTLPAMPQGGLPNQTEVISGIYAASPSDVWATTLLENGQDFEGTPSVYLHWDGSSWATISVPGPKEWALKYWENSVSGTGSADAWAVGFAYNDAYGTAVPQVVRLSCG